MIREEERKRKKKRRRETLTVLFIMGLILFCASVILALVIWVASMYGV